MNDNNYERYLERYSNEQLKRECEIIEKVFDVADVDDTLLIEELDNLQLALYRTIWKRFINNELFEPVNCIIREFSIVN